MLKNIEITRIVMNFMGAVQAEHDAQYADILSGLDTHHLNHARFMDFLHRTVKREGFSEQFLDTCVQAYSSTMKKDHQTPIVVAETFTVAHLNWEGDGITAMYRGDQLVMEGDEYHNKITTAIDSYLEGLAEGGVNVIREDIYVSGDHFEEFEAPEGLDELKEGWPWTEDTD